jgi:membrane-associated protease RseP (regulator of RpoE activity)
MNLRPWVAGIGVAMLLAATNQVSMARADETRDPAGSTPWLGTYLQELTPELRDGLDYRGEGVLVSGVVDDSPADRAGIRKGDVITRVESRVVTSPAALTRIIRSSHIGESLTVQVNRHGAREVVEVRLAARPADEDFGMREAPPAPPVPPDADRHEDEERNDDDHHPAPDADDHDDHAAPDADDHGDHAAPDARDHGGHPGPGAGGDHDFTFEFPRDGMSMMQMGRGRLGVRIESLNSEIGDYFGVPEGKGVLVMEVLKDTPAERAGLHGGDVITRVGDREVHDADDLVNALRAEEGRVSLSVVRHGTQRTIEADLGKADQRVIRIRRGDGMLGFQGDGRSRAPMNGVERDDMRREIKELKDELKDLRKELENLKHD